MSPETHNFLSLLDACDNFRLSTSSEPLAPWLVRSRSSTSAIGLLRPVIIHELQANDARRVADGLDAHWEIHDTDGRTMVSFCAHLSTPSQRSSVMKGLCEQWRDAGLFPDIIGPAKWRGELYPVYLNPFGPRILAPNLEAGTPEEDEAAKTCPNYAFAMERAACALFGVVTYGVHMSVYEKDEEGLRVWVPQRARTKQTWPGRLDNTVAGGIPAGYGAFESIIKESMEEASIKESVVRKHARCAGSISYFFQTTAGWLQPEVQYVYDLPVPSSLSTEARIAFQPKPLDGEVESFELLPLDQVIAKMREGLFKPNCALKLIDFLIRHGHLTPENEPAYMEIITRLHGRFEFERWL